MRGPLIRCARPEDEDGLGGLVADRHRLGWRVRHAATGRATMLVARSGAIVCGALSIRWAEGCDPPHPWLYGGTVLPALRGRCLRTALWRAGHARCVERAATAVTLDVEVDNTRARRLYERLGYRVVGPHRHRWVARDIDTGQVTATGRSATWLMWCALR